MANPFTSIPLSTSRFLKAHVICWFLNLCKWNSSHKLLPPTQNSAAASSTLFPPKCEAVPRRYNVGISLFQKNTTFKNKWYLRLRKDLPQASFNCLIMHLKLIPASQEGRKCINCSTYARKAQGLTYEVQSMNLEDWRSLSNSYSVCYWLGVSLQKLLDLRLWFFLFLKLKLLDQ